MFITQLVVTALLILSTLDCVSSLSRTCADIECTRLPLVPPRWSHNGKDVANIALMCEVHSNCSLDIDDILRHETTHGDDMDQQFVSVDLHFTCSNSSKLDFSETALHNDSLCATIRYQDCTLSWESLADLGRKLHLLHVETIITPTSPPPPSRIPASSPHISGLKEIDHLQLTFINISIVTQIEDYFMLKDQPMVKLGSLSMECFEGNKRANKKCSTPVVTFDQSKLNATFPHLQTLVIAGVYPTDLDTDLAFPWDPNTMPLPLNFSHSKFQHQLYTDGYIIHQGVGTISRTLAVVGDIGINVTKLCPYQKMLNVVVFREYKLNTIPPDCFSPSPDHKSYLYHVDLSRNSLTGLPDDLFRGLGSLQELHVSNNQILKLKPGQFDDLTRLHTISFDINNITQIKAGTFTKLVSMKKFFIHENMLTSVEPGSLPNYSHNLTFLDFRWNDLERLPIDCVTLPNLDLCDCDHNKRLSLVNMAEIISFFNPIKMYLVQPLAYYGETFSYSEVGLMHETDQSEISLRDCGVTQIEFNLSWPHESQKQLAAFLSFFEINLGTILPTDKQLQCDCNLFDLKMFIGTNQARAPVSLLSGSKYLHSLILSFTNFQTWKCQANPILMLDYSQGSFLSLDSDYFICPDKSLTCPPKCTCYRGAIDYRLIIDCSNRTINSFPENILLPEGIDGLMVSLENNSIVTLPDCDEKRYEWLGQVTHLNLQHNEITPEKLTSFDKFLRCMPKITHLFLAYNNIKYLPPSIRRRDFQALSISGNKLTCCDTHWMKEWLQEKNETIWGSLTVHCENKVHPIVQLDPDQFSCPGIVRYLGPTMGLVAFTIFLIIVGSSVYIHMFELKILLFEKLNFHPFDKHDDSDPTKTHDVLLLYSDDYGQWATGTLLPGLEKLGFRVFVPERDIMIGSITDESMATALTRTHRVVVVLSQRFIDDNESMKCFYHAHQHENSPIRKRYLVLIKVNQKIDYKDYDIFKKYISTNFFVSAKSKKFWANLRYWLPLVQDRLPDITANFPEDTEEENDGSVDSEPNEQTHLITGHHQNLPV